MKNFEEFKERVKTDKEFAAKLKDIKTPEAAVELGKAEGYTFTVEDVKEHTNLSDEDLDAVAGGVGTNIIVTGTIKC